MRRHTELRVLERLLRETEESVWEEESPDEVFGAVAFGEERHGEGEKEADTPDEAAAYRALWKHIVHNDVMPAPAVATLRDLLARGKYPATIAPPRPGSLIYRGMGVGRAWLEGALGRKLEKGEKSGEETARFVFRPLPGRTVTSWTSTTKSAAHFTLMGGLWEPYAITLTAAADDNRGVLLDLVPAIYDLGNISLYIEGEGGEAEVLALGPVAVNKVSWRKRG